MQLGHISEIPRRKKLDEKDCYHAIVPSLFLSGLWEIPHSRGVIWYRGSMVWYGVEIVRLLQWYNSNSTLSCLADNALWGYCSRRPTHPKFDSGIGWSDSRVLGIKKFASMYIYGMFSLNSFFWQVRLRMQIVGFVLVFCARIWIWRFVDFLRHARELGWDDFCDAEWWEIWGRDSGRGASWACG